VAAAWFNPRPTATEGDVPALAALAPYPRTGAAVRADLAESLVFSRPRSGSDRRLVVRRLPHRVVTLRACARSRPSGCSAERGSAERALAFFDQVPGNLRA
jgi:hypothetical protein